MCFNIADIKKVLIFATVSNYRRCLILWKVSTLYMKMLANFVLRQALVNTAKDITQKEFR